MIRILLIILIPCLLVSDCRRKKPPEIPPEAESRVLTSEILQSVQPGRTLEEVIGILGKPVSEQLLPKDEEAMLQVLTYRDSAGAVYEFYFRDGVLERKEEPSR